MSDPDALLIEVGRQLFDEVGTALGPWIVRRVEDVHRSWDGEFPAAVRLAAQDAAARASAAVMPVLGDLVAADVDDQTSTPLQIVRGAVRFPTEVLAGAGVPEIVRDQANERFSPDDVYGLEPAALSDLDPDLHTIGLVWGAAKARAYMSRHQNGS